MNQEDEEGEAAMLALAHPESWTPRPAHRPTWTTPPLDWTWRLPDHPTILEFFLEPSRERGRKIYRVGYIEINDQDETRCLMAPLGLLREEDGKAACRRFLRTGVWEE